MIEINDDKDNASSDNNLNGGIVISDTDPTDKADRTDGGKKAAEDHDGGNDKNKKGDKKSSAIKELISWIEVFAVAIIAALFINTFIIANSTVPTGSMENTIEEDDRVIGSRLSYTFGEPERGDIAIFKFGWICNRCNSAQGEGEAPETCPRCGKEITHPKTLYYLKRVIGVPGDKIEIKKNGTVRQSELKDVEGLDQSKGDDAELITAAVYLNGEKLDEEYLKEPMLYTGDMEFEVPENCYFMMGDNRNNSLDARYWNNPYISKDKMTAKVMFRYYPHPSIVK